jgi:hypothetical protein
MKENTIKGQRKSTCCLHVSLPCACWRSGALREHVDTYRRRTIYLQFALRVEGGLSPSMIGSDRKKKGYFHQPGYFHQTRIFSPTQKCTSQYHRYPTGPKSILMRGVSRQVQVWYTCWFNLPKHLKAAGQQVLRNVSYLSGLGIKDMS